MTVAGILSVLLTLGLAYGAALAFERVSHDRGFLPPLLVADPVRRWAARVVLTGILWIAVFASLFELGGGGPEPDLSGMNPGQLFLLHGLLAVSLLAWLLVAFGRFDLGRFLRHLGLVPPRDESGSRASGILTESILGLGAGMAAWLVTVTTMILLAVLLSAVAGEEAIPQQPPALIPFLVGLPLWIRLLVAVSAGVVEEVFFRGFLQPRMGIVLSTVCFALAHASYQNPIMLVGVTILSLIFAGLVKWRRNVWAAMIAHFVFDAVQLLVVVPRLLDMMPGA